MSPRSCRVPRPCVELSLRQPHLGPHASPWTVISAPWEPLNHSGISRTTGVSGNQSATNAQAVQRVSLQVGCSCYDTHCPWRVPELNAGGGGGRGPSRRAQCSQPGEEMERSLVQGGASPGDAPLYLGSERLIIWALSERKPEIDTGGGQRCPHQSGDL